MSPKQRQLVTIGFIGIAVILVWGTVTAISHRGKAHVDIEVSPTDSSLFIDGQSAKPGKRWMTKTTHTFKASRKDFADDSKTVNLTSIDTSLPIYLTPKPNSAAAEAYLKAHPQDQAKREAAGGANEQRIQDQLSKNTLIGQLPYTAPGFEFSVDYNAESDNNGNVKVTLYISANTDKAKQDALDWIKSQGTDPNTQTIIYRTDTSLTSNDSGGGSNPGGFH